MARRSARFKAVDGDGDENMEVEDHVDDKEVKVEEGIDDEMDNEGLDAAASPSGAGRSKKVQDDEADEEEEDEVDASMADPAVPNNDQPDDMEVEVEVEVEANTSIGSTRPSRKAAQEATKKIEAGKVKIEDNATKKGKGKGKAKVLSDIDSEQSEEEDTKPKVKGKGTGKGKGKGKKVNIASDAESEFGVETKPIKGGKKQILAKAVYWKDIPKWSKGSKSLLMELPGDIMDNIFGFREELGLAEYVALAGVCKTFRHHLNDDFFQAVVEAKGFESRWDPDNKVMIKEPDHDKRRRALNPFSRDIPDWRVTAPRPYTYTGQDKAIYAQLMRIDPKPYTPRGERSTWSQAQYTVYKEEQRFCREERWAVRKPLLDSIVKEFKEASSKRQWMNEGGCRRTILAKVAGRKSGQPAVKKDKKGLPIIEASEDSEEEASEGDEPSSDEEEEDVLKEKTEAGPSNNRTRQSRSDAKLNDKTQVGSTISYDKSRVRNRKRAHVSDSEEEEETPTQVTEGDKVKPKKTIKKQRKEIEQAWVVPDSSDESETELDYMRKQGMEIIHDHWPSSWRVKAATKANDKKVDRAKAIAEFLVTEAQLLTLRHILVPNLSNTKRPIQLYFRTAVQALVWRAHGGIEGHAEVVAKAQTKALEQESEQLAQAMKARKNCTYRHKRSRPSDIDWLEEIDCNLNRCYCAHCYMADVEGWCPSCGDFH